MIQVNLTLEMSPMEILHLIIDLMDCPKKYSFKCEDSTVTLICNKDKSIRYLASGQIQHYLHSKLSQEFRQEMIKRKLDWGKEHNFMTENNIDTFWYDEK